MNQFRYRGHLYCAAQPRADKTTELKKPTRAMVDFFKQRTMEHINSVIKFMLQLDGFGEFSAEELRGRAKLHDQDKYTDPDMVLPYVWVTEYYRVLNLEGSVDDDLQRQYDLASEASGNHVEQNQHHPEAHGSTEDMTSLDLAEMVCDWAAMAEELDQGSPRGWADQNVGTKWEFSPDQTDFIYSCIDWLEGQAADDQQDTTANVNTKPEGELNARRPDATKRARLPRASTGGLGSRIDVEREKVDRNQRRDREPDRHDRAPVGDATETPSRVEGAHMMARTRAPHIRLAIEGQPETNDPTVGPEHDGPAGTGGPSESALVDQLEEDPGANWEEVYLQPVIRAIRNKFDLEEGQVVLVGPKKKVPFGTDTLGFDITGHVRFEDFVPPEDQAGTAPFKFVAHVDPQGELMLPIEVRGGAMDNGTEDGGDL